MAFSDEEKTACCRLLTLALSEDFGEIGDLTGQAVIPDAMEGCAQIVARKSGVLAGLPVIDSLLEYTHDPLLEFTPQANDGDALTPGMILGQLEGNMRSILAYERTILNFLQRLSGIATLTHTYVELVKDLPCQILDTRKTTPGWRILEKHAVRCGGGTNHRMGLYDGVMIKDNHLAALRNEPDSISQAVQMAKARYGARVPIEIEVDTLEQLEQALPANPDIVLLDNMTNDQLRSAVQRRDAVAPDVLLEASGGVTLDTLRGIAETRVDRISVGALTHSAIALDIGLDYV